MAARTPRNGKGRFTRTADTRKRDYHAAELHGQGWSYQRIADELGFASRGHAHDAVMRAFADIPTGDAEAAKRLDLERLDRLIEWNWEVMLKPHLAHSNGRIVRHITGVERDDSGEIVRDLDGKPVYIFEDVYDDAPGQASSREIRALIERRAKIIGYEAPAKSRVEVVPEEAVDAEIRQLEARRLELVRGKGA